MVFSTLLGIASRVSGGSWGIAAPQGMPTSAMARVMPRTLATVISRPGILRLQHKPPLLLWCQRSAISNLSNPRRESAVVPVSRCVSRASFIRSSHAMAAAGEAVGEGVTFVETEAATRRNADSGMVAFVTGSNRGIGMEVTRQLLAKTKGTVVAACRNPSSAKDLHALGQLAGNQNRLDVVQMDIEDQASLDTAAEHVKRTYGRVDLLFNVAGVLGDGKNTPGPERSLRAMDREWLRHTLEVNTIGPMMLVAALAPLLESPAKKGDDGARPPSVVVNFSARVGSIGD
ncbi:unnamed protein product, partial [Hapterophycus canaliculatus]